jgi:4-hydroxybenzoate polyprenyltransferase
MVIIHFLRLIRLPNLLMIALTQYLIRYSIIKPIVEQYNFELMMSHKDFFILSLSTVMIAAAGYVINDYFDVKVDKVNKPKDVIIGTHIKRRVAMGAHIVLNFIGLGLGAYAAHRVGNLHLIVIHAFAAFSLWYYSTNFKYDLLIGNFVVAMLAAFVPLIVGLYEVPLLNEWRTEYFVLHKIDSDFNFNHVAFYTIGFAIFAFLMTFAREITKDCADIDGDSQHGATTLTIVFGEMTAKITTIVFYIATMAGLVVVQQLFLPDLITLTYVIILCLLIAFAIFKTLKAKDRTQFLFASNLNKIISLLGILYAVLFPIILKKFIG